VDRRSVVVGLVAVGGSAGLTLTSCGTAAGDRRAGPGTGAGTGTGEDTEADRRLVSTALNAELAAVDALERTRRRHGSLRGVTDQALLTHRSHVALLRGTVDGTASGPAQPTRVPGRPAEALRALARLEAQLSEDHVTTAMAARSGALARVVASLAVAAAQLEQVLTRDAPAGGGS
jgi:hypothetical protein